MNKCTLFGEDYSYLVPLLLYKSENGYVHSRFANGFNIKIEDSLIFIGNNKNGLLPFGIHLQEEDTLRAVSSVNNGDPVTWNKKNNSIELPRVTISIEKGNSFKNELTTLDSTAIFKASFEQFCSQLVKIENHTGLDVSFKEFLNKLFAAGEQSWLGAEAYLILLMEAAESRDEDLLEKVLRYFLGRGQGLTPSGDDMIVGMLAFDAVSPTLSTSFYKKVSELIEGESITTDVAREYLRYALKQEFSSTVSNLVNALADGNAPNFEKVLYDLVEVGHSSGLDTVLGILIGMLAFRKTKIETN
ncbi:DUF2877 domain-containing protein [Psychrobacillus sp. NEAU-3TGS]|uniref:DUF2877 domain-containing protein n=1 Tax=Psychrobacillus sp. NEAU-3TGS TaxID=2995412 RepID=UPI00249895D8|nr:DUF2877 domain-containing protein [Psychrobacillus sp. NEAU-3TGS]MDI2586920.1 DUF2877 domain-containing protein [Psychrobacillus sp. NEAU-3TGS]